MLAVLAQMANGNAVTVMPVHAELTTQTFATFRPAPPGETRRNAGSFLSLIGVQAPVGCRLRCVARPVASRWDRDVELAANLCESGTADAVVGGDVVSENEDAVHRGPIAQVAPKRPRQPNRLVAPHASVV